jgi:capsule polysaccharide export protein KpsE/RkpR
MTMIERYFIFSNKRKNLDKNPRLKNVSFPIGQSRTEFSRLQDSLLFTVYDDFVKTAITVGRPDKKLNIIEVKVVSGDEEFSKTFTERLVSEANNFYTEIRSKKSRQTLEVLEERINTLKGGLNSSIGSRAATQDANINSSYARAQVPIQRQQVNIQVYSGAYAEMFKNLEIARFQYLNEMPLMQIIDKPDYPMKKIKKGRLLTGIIGAIIFSLIASILLLILRYIKLYRNYVASVQTKAMPQQEM